MNLHFDFTSAAALAQAMMFKHSETPSAFPSCYWDVVVCFFPLFGLFSAEFLQKDCCGNNNHSRDRAAQD